MHHMTGNSCH